MTVTLVNDTPGRVTVEQWSCPPDSCDSQTVAAGGRAKLGTSDRGAENLYRIVGADRTVLGCFPLLYFRRPPVEPAINASQPAQCLTVWNDTTQRVLVEVCSPVDSEWESLSNGIAAGHSELVGVGPDHVYRVVVDSGPDWGPVEGQVVGYVPPPGLPGSASISVSQLHK